MTFQNTKYFAQIILQQGERGCLYFLKGKNSPKTF